MPAELSQRCNSLNLPGPLELKPAFHFQQTFLKILSDKPAQQNTSAEPDWAGELRGFIAADRLENPISHGVAEVARAWLARLEMARIDAELHQYYRHKVKFPDQFSEVEQALPEALRRDPWGSPWAYRNEAPKGLGKLTAQRYQLGPALYPDLSELRSAIGDRSPAKPDGTLMLQQVAGKAALEIRGTGGTSVLQPGGKSGAFTLLYIGNDWALFASVDQLFALPITPGI